MVALPVDRGYIVLRDSARGGISIEVFLRPPTAGDLPFACYSDAPNPVLDANVLFERFAGDGRVSVSPVEVRFVEDQGSVHILNLSTLNAASLAGRR